MKRLTRFLAKFLAFAILLFFAVLALNTIRYSSKQIPVKPIIHIPIDDKVVSNLSEAIKIPTVSYENGSDTASIRQFHQFIEHAFPLVDSFLEHKTINNSIIFKWIGKNSHLDPILLTAHLDVVPVEAATLSKWTKDPFSGEVYNGVVWGRGTLDDKGALMAILEAVEYLLSQDYQPSRPVFIAFGHDEEIGGVDGAKAIADYFQKNGQKFEFVLDEGQVILENALSSLDAPLAMIGIAEKGSVTLSLKASSESGHSSMPPRSTAIGVLSNAIKKLQDNPFPAKIDGATQEMFSYVGPEMGLPFKVLFANLWFSRPIIINQLSSDKTSSSIIRTTTAPTILQAGMKDNVLPNYATGKINFRILPGETIETVKAYVEKTINSDSILVEVADPEWACNPSPVSSIESFGFKVIQKTIQELFPEVVVAPSLVIAATDGRHYQEVAENVYRFLPIKVNRDDLTSIHGINEKIEIETYKKMIRFYMQLIQNSCK